MPVARITLNMRNDAHYGRIAVKLCLAGAGLLVVALVLPLSGVFRDANPLGVAMFLGLLFGIPTMFFAVWAVVALAMNMLWPTDPDSNQILSASDLPSICPNYATSIPADWLACPTCRARFGSS